MSAEGDTNAWKHEEYRNECAECLMRLAPGGLAARAPDICNPTRFHDACKRDLPKAAALILSSRAVAVDHRNADGDTGLIEACFYGSDDVVAVLLAAGADVNITGTVAVRQSALHVACRWGRASIVEQLLKAGANINALDADGRTPIALAGQAGHATVAVALARAGADTHLVDKTGRTALHHACCSDPAVLQLAPTLTNAPLLPSSSSLPPTNHATK